MSATTGEDVTRTAPSRAGRREWLGLAVIAIPCLLYAMDLTVLNLAVPSLSVALAPSSIQLLWIVDIYGFVLAGCLVTMGNLGDRIGRRRLLLLGAAAFGLASMLAAFSSSAAMLIAARAFLGIAGATLAPSTLSLIRSIFTDARQRTVAISVWTASFSAGAAVGPLIGGLLLAHFWWGSVFLVSVPVMVVLLALGPVLLPEFRDPAAGGIDVPSAALSLIAVLAMIYGLKQIAQDGVGWAPTAAIVLGLAVSLVFVRRQGTLAAPLIDIGLLRIPAFSAALTTNLLGFFALFGISLFVAQYMQLVLGLAPFYAALWMIPPACAFIVGSALTPVVARRVRPAFVMGAGLVVAAIGFALFTLVARIGGLAAVVAGDVILSFGITPVITLAADLVVGAAPAARAGAAASVSETSSELGGALGIAILGSIGAALYRRSVADAYLDGVPAEAIAAAQGTLGGAEAAATHLPEQLGAALIAVARRSFVEAFAWTAAISVAIVLAAAVIAMVLLRHMGAPSDEAANSGSDDSGMGSIHHPYPDCRTTSHGASVAPFGKERIDARHGN